MIKTDRCQSCGYAPPAHSDMCLLMEQSRTTMPRVIRDVNPSLLNILLLCVALVVVCCGGAILTARDLFGS